MEVTKSVASFFVALEVNEVVIINGKSFDFDGISVKACLVDSGYDLLRVAVELNGNILSKKLYENTYLKDDDKLEVVSFVGGG